MGNHALETALTATQKLNELTENSDYTGEGIFTVKAKCLTKYQKSLCKIILTKKMEKSLTTVESDIFETCKNRTILERIRPLELKLQPKIDKMIKIQDEDVLEENSGNEDEMEEEIESDIEDDVEGEKTIDSDKVKKYVPPKLNSVPYPGELEPETSDKKLEREEKAKKRALMSSQLEAL